MSSWERSACYPRSTFYPLSDGPSMRNRRITMLKFPSCSTCLSLSQAPLCHCTLRPVANRPEGTFRSLRYAFGGDHPSQTTRQAMSAQQRALEARCAKARISTAAPRELAPPAQSLRTILHIAHPAPMLSCSKGSRGLFVPLRVIGIFTAQPCVFAKQLPGPILCASPCIGGRTPFPEVTGSVCLVP